MPTLVTKLRTLRAVADPAFLRVRPSITRFLVRYLGKFRVQAVGEHLVVHSHLPPIGSAAFRRFTRLHLIQKTAGPTHAQIGVTAICPQRCGYCYNRGRTGQPLDSNELRQAIKDLQALGVVWLGFTGGEPLLCPDLEDLVELAAKKCAVKIFTTGDGLTVERARSLGRAGCFSIAISLDDWREPEHDAARGVVGAFATAIKGVRAALEAGNVHVSVSAVVSLKVIRAGQVHALLDFLRTLGVHEAWLSEPKPAAPAAWGIPTAFTEDDRRTLAKVQDESNQKNGMTVNYLGHFEAPEHFGCNAGNRMVYVDPWGDVSPCVFVPLSMGNLRTRPLAEIDHAMRAHFPPRRTCFAHDNHKLFRIHQHGRIPLGIDESLAVLAAATPSTPSDFIQLLRERGDH